MTHTLFTYGTLQDPEVQKKVFGRTAKGLPDALSDYAKSTIEINGNTYLLVIPAPGEKVQGLIIEVEDDELEKIDDYETKAYRREEIALESGIFAWVYVKG